MMDRRTCRHANRGMRGFAAASLAVWSAFAFAQEPPRSELAAGPAVVAARNNPQLRQRFFDEYPEAVKRLESAVQRLRGKARFRRATPDEPNAPWSNLSFTVFDGKLRLDEQINLGRAGKGKVQSRAILLTPDLAAQVYEPCTDAAWAKYVGDRPDKGTEMRVNVEYARLAKATYCCDGHPILEEIQNGLFVVGDVYPHSAHPDWVVVACTFQLKDEKGPRFSPHGTFAMALSPSEDWAIRESKMQTGNPSNFVSSQSVQVERLSGVGVVPRKYTNVVRDVTKPDAWREWNEGELLEAASPAAVDDSEFTLTALGVMPPAKRWNLMIWIALLNVLIVAAAIGIYLCRRQRRLRAGG